MSVMFKDIVAMVTYLVVVVVLIAAAALGEEPNKDKKTISTLDLMAEKRVQVCSRQKRTLSCSSGSSIAVTGVFWGRKSADICPSEDGDPVLDCGTAPKTEEIVKKSCEGMGSCLLEAKANLLQKEKHCYGVNKYLLVNYTCVPKENQVILCNSEDTMLSCPSDWVVRVNSAFWGRESTGICPSDNGKVICSGASETVSKLRTNCNNNPGCVVRAQFNELQNGGENCPRVSKYLIVNYACRPSAAIARRGNLGRIPLSLYRRLGYRSKIPHPPQITNEEINTSKESSNEQTNKQNKK